MMLSLMNDVVVDGGEGDGVEADNLAGVQRSFVRTCRDGILFLDREIYY